MPARKITEKDAEMKKSFVLRDIDGCFYAGECLDTTPEVSRAMKFDTEADALRVKKNLNDKFILPFYVEAIFGETFGTCGIRWHVETCELCGRLAGEMEDPTFDATRVLPGGRALWICEPCAKERIESEMMRIGVVVH